LGCSITSWNRDEVNFHMDPDSCSYLSCSVRNQRIIDRRSFCPGCCATVFWPNGPCIKLSSLGTCPRVGERPQHLCGRPPPVIHSLAATVNIRVLFRSSLALLLACKRAWWSSCPSSSLRNPTSFDNEFEIETYHSHLVTLVLVQYLFLLVL
jgi:hypothetical protein